MITIELFGIARHRAGLPSVELRVDAESISLGDLLERLADQLPSLRGECIANGRLGPACVANIDGQQFVGDPEICLQDGQSLMLMSADAGG